MLCNLRVFTRRRREALARYTSPWQPLLIVLNDFVDISADDLSMNEQSVHLLS